MWILHHKHGSIQVLHHYQLHGLHTTSRLSAVDGIALCRSAGSLAQCDTKRTCSYIGTGILENVSEASLCHSVSSYKVH